MNINILSPVSRSREMPVSRTHTAISWSLLKANSEKNYVMKSQYSNVNKTLLRRGHEVNSTWSCREVIM